MSQRARLVLLALFLVAFFALGRALHLDEVITVERIRSTMQSAGWGGFAMFVVLTALAGLVQVPALVFLAAAVLAYGKFWGAVAGIVGGIAAMFFQFWVVRGIGGQPLSDLEQPLARKILAGLDARPLRTVFLVRTFFMALPAVNYALAMSSVRFREYAVGSALGLIIPFSLLAAAFDFVLVRFL